MLCHLMKSVQLCDEDLYTLKRSNCFAEDARSSLVERGLQWDDFLFYFFVGEKKKKKRNSLDLVGRAEA